MKGGIIFLFLLLNLGFIYSADGKTQFNIVFVGDSITEGSTGSGYITKLPDQGDPWNRSDVQLINSGVNGRQMKYYYQYQDGVDQYVLDNNPNVVFIYLGLNDLNNQNAEDFELHYNWFVEAILDNVDENLKQIYLMQFSWSGSMPATAYSLADEFNLIIGDIATKFSLGLINLWDLTETQHDYFVDGVHPNDLGAEIIASKIHNDTNQEIENLLTEFENSTNSETELGGNYTLVLLVCIFALKQKKQRN